MCCFTLIIIIDLKQTLLLNQDIKLFWLHLIKLNVGLFTIIHTVTLILLVNVFYSILSSFYLLFYLNVSLYIVLILSYNLRDFHLNKVSITDWGNTWWLWPTDYIPEKTWLTVSDAFSVLSSEPRSTPAVPVITTGVATEQETEL